MDVGFYFFGFSEREQLVPREAGGRALRAEQGEDVQRVAGAYDQILLAVEHPGRRPVAHTSKERKVPQGFPVRRIVRDEMGSRAAREEQLARGGQNAGSG